MAVPRKMSKVQSEIPKTGFMERNVTKNDLLMSQSSLKAGQQVTGSPKAEEDAESMTFAEAVPGDDDEEDDTNFK